MSRTERILESSTRAMRTLIGNGNNQYTSGGGQKAVSFDDAHSAAKNINEAYNAKVTSDSEHEQAVKRVATVLGHDPEQVDKWLGHTSGDKLHYHQKLDKVAGDILRNHEKVAKAIRSLIAI